MRSCRELTYIGETMKVRTLDTIYIGGGLPPPWNRNNWSGCLAILRHVFRWNR